jgi:hypothetical protein
VPAVNYTPGLAVVGMPRRFHRGGDSNRRVAAQVRRAEETCVTVQLGRERPENGGHSEF